MNRKQENSGKEKGNRGKLSIQILYQNKNPLDF